MIGDIDSRKSTSDYVMTYLGGAVSWRSNLQKCVTLSTTKVEYIAAIEAFKEFIWMKDLLKELGVTQKKYLFYCDTHSDIHLAKNPTYHFWTKHIDMRCHWIQDELQSELQLEKIHTDNNISDMMMKSLLMEKLVRRKYD